MLLALLYKIITKLWCYLKCHLIYSCFIYFLNNKEIIFFFFNNKEKSFRLGQKVILDQLIITGKFGSTLLGVNFLLG